MNRSINFKYYKRSALSALFMLLFLSSIYAQARFNHPELKWKTFETAHFKIHYHEGSEWTANQSADIAEAIYGPVTSFYDFEPDSKTDLVIKDSDDFSNGAAYYYDNKIEIWATPLDFLLRGNHSWLRDVITHEFTHIVSLQKAMKYPRNFPGAYFQVIDYEDEKRDDVIYGYPRIISSYPLPAMIIPMWLAEGIAQYMFPNATNDLWDSHRDMLLRDRTLHGKILTLSQMGSFGKRGIGNESVYNQGLAFIRYLIEQFGMDICPNLTNIMASPIQVSINTALRKATGIPGKQIYKEWKYHLEDHYKDLTAVIQKNAEVGKILIEGSATNIYPEWVGDSLIYYLSNKGKDYFSQTSLYVYNIFTKKSALVKPGVRSRISISPDGRYIYYSKKSKPNKYGSIYYDIYKLDLKKNKEDQITKFERAYNPSLSPDGTKLAFVTGRDGTSNLVIRDLSKEKDNEKAITKFNNGEELFSSHWSPDGKQLSFDYMTNHGRDISIYDLNSESITLFEGEDYDTRNPYFSSDGKWLYFASDETGIFNIYRKSLITKEKELLTNVLGGAFMPSVNEKGDLLFSLFDDSSYKIGLLNEYELIESFKASYSDYAESIPDMMPVKKLNHPEPVKYKDQFSKIFILPKLMIDYGTVKPGFYFYSSEVIDRFTIFGGTSINKIKDRDLFLILEYHQWKPTFHIEFFNISRNIFNVTEEISNRPASFDYTFALTEFTFGISRWINSINHLRFNMTYSKYRTTTDTKIPSEKLYQNGFSYDYYNGLNFNLNWRFRKIRPNVNIDTNPNNGILLNTVISRNYDKFIKGFDVNNSYGTLEVDFRNNYYWKIEHEGIWHHKYPVVDKLIGSLKWKIGWISKYDIDSFFNFFAGGMPGLQGYPFYSIEGRNLFSLHYTFRFPLFVEKDVQLLPFNLQNAFIATYFEAGNAWNQVEGYKNLRRGTLIDDPIGIIKSVANDFKKDIGFQLRFSGFSFYAYPTAISLDFVYGMDKFEVMDRQSNIHDYGKEWRSYLTILFGL